MLHRAQVLGVHDVGAVLVFHHRHQFARTVLLFEQIDFVRQRMARQAAAIGQRAFLHLG